MDFRDNQYPPNALELVSKKTRFKSGGTGTFSGSGRPRSTKCGWTGRLIRALATANLCAAIPNLMPQVWAVMPTRR